MGLTESTQATCRFTENECPRFLREKVAWREISIPSQKLEIVADGKCRCDINTYTALNIIFLLFSDLVERVVTGMDHP